MSHTRRGMLAAILGSGTVMAAGAPVEETPVDGDKFTHNGWNIHFTGFKSQPERDALVGQWLAVFWLPRDKKYFHGFYSSTSGPVKSFHLGDYFETFGDCRLTSGSTQAEKQSSKASALRRLIEFLGDKKPEDSINCFWCGLGSENQPGEF